MKRMPWLAAALLIFVVVLALVAWSVTARPPTRLEQESASRPVKGLGLRVKELSRQGGEVRMTYVFEWVEDPGVYCFGYPWEGIHSFFDIDIGFFDSGGRLVGTAQEANVFVGEDFERGPPSGRRWLSRRGLAELLSRRSSRSEGTCRFSPPPGAKLVGLRVPFVQGPALVTRPVPIPGD